MGGSTNQIMDARGDPLRALEGFQICTFELVKAQAIKIFHDYTTTTLTFFPANMIHTVINLSNEVLPEDLLMFYCCVCSKLIVKRIENSLFPALFFQAQTL